METILETSGVGQQVNVHEKDGLDKTPEEEESERTILSNNFILPLEPVEMMGSSTLIDVKTSKKSKKEKKDGRFYKFVKKHFLQRRNSSNDVREIHIVPDDDELKWARRSGGSAASRSSDETVNSEEDRLEVVHDMAEEYIPDV